MKIKRAAWLRTYQVHANAIVSARAGGPRIASICWDTAIHLFNCALSPIAAATQVFDK